MFGFCPSLGKGSNCLCLPHHFRAIRFLALLPASHMLVFFVPPTDSIPPLIYCVLCVSLFNFRIGAANLSRILKKSLNWTRYIVLSRNNVFVPRFQKLSLSGFSLSKTVISQPSCWDQTIALFWFQPVNTPDFDFVDFGFFWIFLGGWGYKLFFLPLRANM